MTEENFHTERKPKGIRGARTDSKDRQTAAFQNEAEESDESEDEEQQERERGREWEEREVA